ncbi:hypothetical protein NKH18_45400 [Streptomyces sp. M10(2022)]
MQSKRDQVQAHMFIMGRLTSACCAPTRTPRRARRAEPTGAWSSASSSP